MKKINVKILEEYRGHMNPDRKFHLVDIETGRELVGNLKKEEIKNYANSFHLTLAEKPFRYDVNKDKGEKQHVEM